jgi:hypothetical protein
VTTRFVQAPEGLQGYPQDGLEEVIFVVSKKSATRPVSDRTTHLDSIPSLSLTVTFNRCLHPI